MDKNNPVIVARTWMNSEASVIKSLLEGYNIPCHYTPFLPNRIYPLSAKGLAEIRIYVPLPFADVARQVLQDHRRRDAVLRLVDVDEEK